MTLFSSKYADYADSIMSAKLSRQNFINGPDTVLLPNDDRVGLTFFALSGDGKSTVTVGDPSSGGFTISQSMFTLPDRTIPVKLRLAEVFDLVKQGVTATSVALTTLNSVELFCDCPIDWSDLECKYGCPLIYDYNSVTQAIFTVPLPAQKFFSGRSNRLTLIVAAEFTGVVPIISVGILGATFARFRADQLVTLAYRDYGPVLSGEIFVSTALNDAVVTVTEVFPVAKALTK